MNMDDKLKRLFDFQKFENNEELGGVINMTVKKNSFEELDDEALEFVAAAGAPSEELDDGTYEEDTDYDTPPIPPMQSREFSPGPINGRSRV